MMAICSSRAQRVTSRRCARSTTGSARSPTGSLCASYATPPLRRTRYRRRSSPCGGRRRGSTALAEGVDLDSHARAPTGCRRRAQAGPLQRASRPARGDRPQTVVAESAEDDVALRASRGDVQAALATLSKTEREVLDLAYWGGLTQSEIAIALDIPCGTVKSRTFSALARLRESLSQAPKPEPCTTRGPGVTRARRSNPASKGLSSRLAMV